jgi:hypothetical protein
MALISSGNEMVVAAANRCHKNTPFLCYTLLQPFVNIGKQSPPLRNLLMSFGRFLAEFICSSVTLFWLFRGMQEEVSIAHLVRED